MFIEGLEMVHRRLQEGLLSVHGSTEDLHKTKATAIPVTVGTFEARQKHKGPKVTTVMRVAMRTAPILLVLLGQI